MHIKKYTEKDRYGNTFSYEFDVPSLQEIPQPDPSIFKPKGTDTVPAMLTPGENVINAEASRLPGVQPMLDDLNDMGRAIQKKQGGPIPSYNAEGGPIIDDTMLDAIKQVESGGDVNAVSEVGASGPYQIMKATALKPGYGVTPIGLDERFDPDKSRAFAKQYLQGIMKANPDFTKDEVITAYHSGAGNVRKSKMGQEELGPRGQEYADKVNIAMNENEVPMPMARPVVYDSTPMESGIMSAQASTKDDSVPKEEKELGFLESIKKKFDETFPSIASDPTIQKIRTKNKREQAKEEENIVKKGTLFSKGLDDAEKDLSEFKKELRKKGSNVTDSDAEKLKQLTETRDSLKSEYKNKVKERKEIEKPTSDELKAKEKIDSILGKKEIADKVVQETNDADYGEGKLNLDEVDDAWAKKNLTGPYQGDFSQYLMNKGQEIGGQVLDKSIEYFGNAFKSMFNGDELAKMALIYAGSRALGYSHGGSLNYSMKNYMKTINANQAYAKKAVLDKDFADRFTAASLATYSQTADPDDLIPKAKSLKLESISGEINVPGYGKATTYKGDDGIDYIKVDGQTYAVPDIKGAEKWDDKVHGDATVAKRYDTFGKAYADALNKSEGLEPGDEGYVAYEPVGADANIAYRRIIRNNKVSISQAPETQRAIERAMEKYLQAKAAYSKAGNTGTKPNNLESFIRIEAFKPLTGISPDMITGTSPENLQKLDDKIKSSMDNKKPFAEEYANEWQAYYKAWVKLPPEERTMAVNDASKKDKGQYSGFTLWVSRTSPDEVNKILKS